MESKSRQFDLRCHLLLEERAFTLFRTYYFKLWTLDLPPIVCRPIVNVKCALCITHRQIKISRCFGHILGV